MEWELKITGDYYEDRQEIKLLVHINEMYCALGHANEIIRQRLKYGEDVSEQEARILEEIRKVLYVEGIEN